jgi:predicted 3-demethylubiquinone-9 3-methyltransferase (glyoxalase superfamily)
MISTQKIRSFLWFDTQAEEAAKHYVAAFKDSKVSHVERYGKSGPGPSEP